MAVYNDVYVVQTQPSIQQRIIYDQQQEAQQNMENAVSDFVEATLAIVETIEVNRLAERHRNRGK